MQMTITLDGSESPSQHAAMAALFNSLAGVQPAATLPPPSSAPSTNEPVLPDTAQEPDKPVRQRRSRSADKAGTSGSGTPETPDASSVTAAQEQVAPAATTPAPVPVPVPVPVPEAGSATLSPATKDDLRAALQSLVDAHGMPEAMKALKSCNDSGGYAMMSAVPDDKLAEVTAYLKSYQPQVTA